MIVKASPLFNPPEYLTHNMAWVLWPELPSAQFWLSNPWRNSYIWFFLHITNTSQLLLWTSNSLCTFIHMSFVYCGCKIEQKVH